MDYFLFARHPTQNHWQALMELLAYANDLISPIPIVVRRKYGYHVCGKPILLTSAV